MEGDDLGVVSCTCSTWVQWSNRHLVGPLKPPCRQPTEKNCKPGDSPKLPEAMGYLNRISSGTRAEGMLPRCPMETFNKPCTLPPPLRREPATHLQPQEDSHSLGTAVMDQEEIPQFSLVRDNFSFSFDFIYFYWSIVDLKYHVSFCCTAKRFSYTCSELAKECIWIFP